jgi:DNA-binding response OmpR family regulator
LLLVEDEPVIRGAVEAFLRLNGHEVVCAADAEEGLRQLEQSSVEGIILDLLLPGMSGLELLEQRLPEHRSLPVLVISGGQPQAMQRSLELGAAEYIPKPFDPSELMACVEHVLAASASSQDGED